MNHSQIIQILKTEFQIEYNQDTIEKLREFSVRVAHELIETMDVIQKNQQRALKKEDVRWVMDDLRTNDAEAFIMKKYENHNVKDFPFEDSEKEKDREIYKAYVPMKNQQNLRRNAQLAIREEIDSLELKRKKDLELLRLKSEQSYSAANNAEKTKYQQIFFDQDEASSQGKKKDFPQIMPIKM